MTCRRQYSYGASARFGKEDTAKELQDHAAKTQDTLVDAVENAEVAEIKRAVFRALTRLRAATIKEFDTIARLETQAIDASPAQPPAQEAWESVWRSAPSPSPALDLGLLDKAVWLDTTGKTLNTFGNAPKHLPPEHVE